MTFSLDSEHWARSLHGGNRQAAAEAVGCAPDEILDFSASLNPLGPPKSVLEAISGSSSAVTHYPDPRSTQLRQALANHYQLDPDWILVGNGAAELFTWIARECAQVGETGVLVPAFGDYARALRAAAAPYTSLSMLDDSDALAPALALQALQDRDRLPPVLLLNNPHNPTGHVWTRTALLDLLPRFRLVIVDEAFMDFLPGDGESLLNCVREWPHVVVVRSLTKFFAIAGLRVGFAVAHPDRLARWQRWRDPWSVNGLATVGAIAALRDREFQGQTYAWLPTARRVLSDGFAHMSGCYVYPSAANYLLVRTEVSVEALQRELLQRDRILIRNCYSFARDGSMGDLTVPKCSGDRFFRVAVRSTAENARLLESCARVLAEMLDKAEGAAE